MSIRQDLRLVIVVWIEREYHRQRLQDTLRGLTPINFKADLTKPLTLAAQSRTVTSSFLTPPNCGYRSPAPRDERRTTRMTA